MPRKTPSSPGCLDFWSFVWCFGQKAGKFKFWDMPSQNPPGFEPRTSWLTAQLSTSRPNWVVRINVRKRWLYLCHRRQQNTYHVFFLFLPFSHICLVVELWAGNLGVAGSNPGQFWTSKWLNLNFPAFCPKHQGNAAGCLRPIQSSQG